MKRIILISAIIAAATSGYAQTTPDNALFRFDNTSSPREISKLGTAPEFPFMRNLSSPKQVVTTLKRNDANGTQGMDQLNELLMAVGFANGAKDVTESNVSMYYVPVGTEGNMGSAGYGNTYAKLTGDASEFKAWKIASGNGNYMLLMAKCGNAFFPNSQPRSACITAPVNITSEPKELTLTANGQTTTTNDNVYVYYHRKRHKRKEAAYAVADVPDAYPSAPLLLNSNTKVTPVPETYKLSVNSTNANITVCPDSTANVAANINVEKTSEYTGYYPSAKKEYKRVSKHIYKKSERKMRKAKRKEEKVARATGVAVQRNCTVGA